MKECLAQFGVDLDIDPEAKEGMALQICDEIDNLSVQVRVA